MDLLAGSGAHGATPKREDEQIRRRQISQMLADKLMTCSLLTLPRTDRGRRWIPDEASVVGGRNGGRNVETGRLDLGIA